MVSNQDYKTSLEQAFELSEGVTYFGMSTLFNFDHVTESTVLA
jgi:hypothetical protein